MLDDFIDFFSTCVLGWLIGLFSWFFGGNNGLLSVLLTFVIIDYIMGLMVAFNKHTLSSSVGYLGIAKKVGIFFLVGITHITSRYIFRDADTIYTAVTLFYIANEGVSVIENADCLGLPIPKFLKTKLLSIKKEINATKRNKGAN